MLFLFSQNTQLDVEAGFESYCGESYQDGYETLSAEDPTNLPNIRGGQETLMTLWEYWRGTWGPNSNAIPAFAAFCKEGCSQSMSAQEAFTLYARFRRDEEIEVVGQMLRPALDGLPRSWG